MSSRRWIADLFRRQPVLDRLEMLEDRVTPALFIVNSTADLPVDLTDAVVTLRDAITAANTNVAVSPGGPTGEADGDIIRFDTATFGGAGGIIILTQGDLPVTDDVTIDGTTGSGTGATLVTVSGGGVSRIFSIETDTGVGTSKAVTLTGLTLTAGDGTGTTAGNDGKGGAIFIGDGEDVTVQNTTVQSSTATLQGGGIYAGNGTLDITSSKIGVGGAGNLAQGAAATDGGGGLYVLGGTATITNSSFTQNQAAGTSGSGGAILLNGGTLTVTGGSITQNQSQRAGGGIEIRSTVSNATATLTNVTVTQNTTGVNPGNGGGLHISTTQTVGGPATATVTVSGGLFSQNTAGNEGGGLWNDTQGSLTITGTTINDNTALGAAADSGGGGVFSQGGTLTITNATIASNDATGTAGSGGGVLVDGGTLKIDGGTITANTAVRAGGGVEVTAANNAFTATLANVTITGNQTGSNPGNGGGVHITDAVGGSTGTMTITGGTIASNTANEEGGGVWNAAESTLNITGTLIAANTANGNGTEQGGGGIFNDGGTVTVTNATIVANQSTASTAGNGGGGIFNDGKMTLTDTTVSANTATTGNADGGGILNSNGGTLTVTGGAISANQAARAGGGIENNAGSVTLSNPTLDANSAGVNGGAVHVTGAGTVTATNTTFSNNQAGNEGGGLWLANDAAATITLNSSTVNNNTATFGGGVFNDGAAGTIVVSNSTISGNNATQDGGAIDSEGGTVTITNSTIASNSAGAVGGGLNLDAGTTATATNSIIADNSAPTGPDVNGTITANFSLIESTAGATINGANNLTGVDPLLGPLADNGGLTQTQLPQAGSPVVNAGDPNFTSPPNFDQRGQPRVIAGRLDIGSVETAARTVLLGTPEFAVGQDQGGGTVRVFNPDGTERFNINPFAGPATGVRVAMADFNNDGIADLVVGTGPGVQARVRVIDGSTQQEIFAKDVFAEGEAFTGGIFVAAGDLTGDGKPDLVVTPDVSGGPRVLVFRGGAAASDFVQVASFFGITGDPNFRGGVRPGVGDMNGDGIADLAVSAGFSGGPRVAVFDGKTITDAAGPTKLFSDIFVFEDTLRNGAFVAIGDVNGDGFGDLISGAGPGGAPRVLTLSGVDLIAGKANTGSQVLANFFAGDVNNRGGIRVAAKDLDGDQFADLVVGSGQNAGSRVTSYLGKNFSGGDAPENFAFDAFSGFTGGVFVG
jgi:hypothetical protein